MTLHPEKTTQLNLHRLLAAVCVLGASALLIIFLNHNGFWIDELYTLHSIRLGWTEMVLERLHRGHFPGYFALARLWYGLWPEQYFEVGLRSLSVLFYMLAVASFWPLARKVLSAPASLVAVALFACNEIALRQAAEARMYTVMLFIAVWITRAWYELQQPGAKRRWSGAMPVLAVAGFAVSATAGILIASMLVVSLLYRRQHPRLLKANALSLVLGLCVFVPGAFMHLDTARRVGVASSKPTVFLAHIVALMPGVQVWTDYYNTTTELLVLLIIGCLITSAAGWVLWKHRKTLPAPLRQMVLIVILPLALIILAYPLIELFSLSLMGPARYFLTLLPMAAMAGGWALMKLPRPLVIHAVLTVFLLFSAWAVMTVKIEQFRTRVVEYLQPQYQPDDGLIVTAHEIEDGVELYVPGADVDEAVSRWIMDKDELRRRLQPLSDRGTVWLVWYRGNDSPLIQVATELWGPFESNRPEKPYGDLRIYKFNPQG